MIGIDPTESREGSRLPEAVQSCAVEIAGFEERTGADMLLTSERILLQDMRQDNALVRATLRKYLESGLLIQRKSGGDFVNSIPDLADIHRRMREWASPERCVLLITDLEFDRNGYAIAGGRSTGWTLESIRGKLRWWCVRGGWYDILTDDDQIGGWLTAMSEILSKCAENPSVTTAPEHPLQKLSSEPDNWVTTGSLFPRGVGRKKREALARQIDPECDAIESPPSLGQVLLYTTSGRLKQAQGWGRTLLDRMREYCGIRGRQVIRDVLGFSEISIAFPKDLPIQVSGEGIKLTVLPDGRAQYTFSEYSALESVALVLSAMNKSPGEPGKERDT